MIHDLAVAAALLVSLLLAYEVGFRGGRRAVIEHDTKAGAQIGAIQGAVLGLLGLLLAFSFSAAGSRFLERQDLIVREANAIGTATLRTDLLDPPHRAELRAALRDYTRHRIDVSAALRHGLSREAATEMEAFHARMWRAAVAGTEARPNAALSVLPPVNDVIDLHSTRVAAGMKRLPALVMGLLIGCSLLSIGCIGYGCGVGGRRRLALTLPLILLVGSALWITIDLDHPRAGLLRLNDAPLKALRFE